MPEHDPTGPTLDEAGVPDLQGPLEAKAATGDGQEGVPSPNDRPASLDWGTTLRERRLGEPIGVRVGRERPDVDEPGAFDPPYAEGFDAVAPGDEDVDAVDDEKDLVAAAVDQRGQMVSPEQAAMHVIEPGVLRDEDDGDSG